MTKPSLAVWDYKRWGTSRDPIHKSDLNDITGEYGCDKQFKYHKDEAAAEAAGRLEHGERKHSVSGKAVCGTATHETMARALTNPEVVQRLLSGNWQVSTPQVEQVFREELNREIGARELSWYKDRPEDLIDDRVAMVVGALNHLHERVEKIVMVEPAFIVWHPDGYWLSGHVDLIYVPRSMPLGLGLSDWKTGGQKPDQTVLDHGWEAGVYSLALHAGHFLGREELECEQLPDGSWGVTARGVRRTHASKYIAERHAAEAALIEYAVAYEEKRGDFDVTLGAFPDEIYHVHMADFVPYRKAGKKEIKRPEDCLYFGVNAGDSHSYKAGQMRGGAWCAVRRTEQDIPRLGYQLRNVVGTTRMGRFAERIGEKCNRCPYRGDCLTSGYEPRKDEAREIERRLRALGADMSDGLDEAV